MGMVGATTPPATVAMVPAVQPGVPGASCVQYVTLEAFTARVILV